MKDNMTTLILAKYKNNNELIITDHVFLGVSLICYGMKKSHCPIKNLNGYSNAAWIDPMVCMIKYMPSNKKGLRQTTFKGAREDKTPEECRII